MTTITDINKEKNLLTLIFDTGQTATFDFQTGTIIGVKHKPVSDKTFIGYFKNYRNRIAPEHDTLWRIIDSVMKLFNWENVIDRLQGIEPYLSYIDMIDMTLNSWERYSLFQKPVKKGYIPWCKKNNKLINLKTQKEYEIYSIASQLAGNVEVNQKILQILMEYCSFAEFNTLSKSLLTRIIKSVKKEWESYKMPAFNLLNKMLTTPHFKPILENYFDSNRTLETNYENLELILNKENKKRILKQEGILNHLEDLDFDDELCVRVPHKLEDFTDEGEQQNNCVGHYYHKNIANGTDLIYFLRHKNNVDKSFVTCRFNTLINCTVETRIKNNDDYENIELFEKIDNEIRQLLLMHNQKEES